VTAELIRHATMTATLGATRIEVFLGRRHHQIPADQGERGGVARPHLVGLSHARVPRHTVTGATGEDRVRRAQRVDVLS
jgi:hypothetical protein